MLDTKIEMIRKKESIILDLKASNKQQREIDLLEIEKLRK
jgi:hypothetical protein